MKKIGIVVLIIILAGLAFRLMSVEWGLPQAYNNDETNYIETAMRIGIGKFEPEQLVHGTLFPEILFVGYALYFLVGRAMGIFTSPDSFILAYMEDASGFIILARLVIIAFSIGSLYLTYLIGKKLFNKKTGAVACFLLSLSTVHYMMSTMGLADMAAVFLALLAFYLLLKYYFCREAARGSRYFYISSFILGLALATKLVVAPAVMSLFIIYGVKEKRLLAFVKRKFILGLFFVFLGFFLAEPYPFLNMGKFLLIFQRLDINFMNAVKVTSPTFSYLAEWLPNCIGKASTVLFLLSLVYFSVFRRAKETMFIAIFPITHFLLYQVLQATGQAYHILSILPFVLLLTSAFLCVVSSKFKRGGTIVLIGMVLLCSFNPTLDSIRYQRVITSEDTRARAREWIEENIPAGETIIIEGVMGNKLVLAPDLAENLESLEDSRKWATAHGGSGRFQKLLIDNYDAGGKRVYRIEKVRQHFKSKDIINTRAEYLITSGFFDIDLGEFEGSRGREYYQERERVRRAIERRFRLVKVFEPFPKFRLFYPMFFTAGFRALRQVDIFKGRAGLMPGPEIGIYKRHRIFEGEDS